MKKFLAIAGCALLSLAVQAQTLFNPNQVRSNTNDFPVGTTVTNLADVLDWIAANWHTNAGYLVSTGVQSGSCTNNQTVFFSPAFTSTPAVVGHYVGTITTNATGHYPVLYLSAVATNSFVFGSTVAQSNTIRWIAR